MKFLLKASEEQKDFYDLIGTEITFASDILTIGGQISHKKGEKAFISDVQYTVGYWSHVFSGLYIEPKISNFRINGVKSTCWKPDIFLEYKQ